MHQRANAANAPMHQRAPSRTAARRRPPLRCGGCSPGWPLARSRMRAGCVRRAIDWRAVRVQPGVRAADLAAAGLAAGPRFQCAGVRAARSCYMPTSLHLQTATAVRRNTLTAQLAKTPAPHSREDPAQRKTARRTAHPKPAGASLRRLMPPVRAGRPCAATRGTFHTQAPGRRPPGCRRSPAQRATPPAAASQPRGGTNPRHPATCTLPPSGPASQPAYRP
jgi:hypothetical protein